MTLTKIYGISLTLLIVLFIPSCSTVKNIQQNGIVLEEMYKYYINDSITLSYRFPADYDQITNHNMIRNDLKKVCKNLPQNYCIAYFKTNNSPAFIHFTFYFPNTKRTLSNTLLNDINKDTNNFYIDTNQYIVGKFINLENNKGSVYIIGHSKKSDFFLLKSEYADIFNEIVTNEKYRDITFTPPFELGRELEILEDTTVNYLTPVYLLKKREPNYTDISSKFNWLQAYSTFVSRLTSEQKETQECVNKFNNSRENFVFSENFLQTNDDALSYLIQKCKSEQVVMINENHFANQHRILGEIILDSLYNYGFRYLAMEAVWENDTALNERGFAITNTGLYAREPIMANLIRKAIDKGYYVFGYDDFTKDREKNQAVNIYQKTLANDSLCKVLVWAGFDHIDEAEKPKNLMAREFFLLTGIDPLTIHQTGFIADEDKYLMVLDTSTLKNRKMACDIFVVNNLNYDLFATKSDYKNYKITIPKEITKQAKRNPLMFMFATKSDYKNDISKEIAKKTKGAPFTFIISIFKADEYQKDKTAIPIYNHVLDNNFSKISIKLPNDKYYYVIRHRFGKIVYQSYL